jgi:hypothetical protein
MSNRTNAKKQLSKISPLSAVIILLFASAMTYFVFRAFAASGTATLYTSPGGSQSVTIGQSFNVSVRLSSGASVPITGAAVYLSYPTDKLQVTGQSYAGSPYNTQLVETNSGGILRMDRAAFPAVSGGDQLFAQVTFKALATGSAAVSFTGSSLVTSGEDDSNILAQKNGVTYTISAPATPPPTTTSGGSSGGSSSGSSGSTSSGSSVSKSSSSTSRPASPSTSGSTTTPAADGTPAATTTSDNETPLTEGAVSSIEIAILDSGGKAIEGASVTLNGQTVKTDAKGIARFTNVPAGQQSVAVQYNGKKTSKVVQVKGASTQASPERFKVAITRDRFNPMVLIIPLFILAAAGILFMQPWKNRLALAGAGAQTSDDIVTSDRLFIETPTNTPKQGPGSVVTPGGQDTPPAPNEPQTTVKPDETPKP